MSSGGAVGGGRADSMLVFALLCWLDGVTMLGQYGAGVGVVVVGGAAIITIFVFCYYR